jgi:hypothetical protein
VFTRAQIGNDQSPFFVRLDFRACARRVAHALRAAAAQSTLFFACFAAAFLDSRGIARAAPPRFGSVTFSIVEHTAMPYHVQSNEAKFSKINIAVVFSIGAKVATALPYVIGIDVLRGEPALF